MYSNLDLLLSIITQYHFPTFSWALPRLALDVSAPSGVPSFYLAIGLE